MTPTLTFSSLSVLLLTACSTGNASEFEKMSDWYKKYPSYPEYCSTPQQLANRKIPPLKKSNNIQTSLVHVTAIIRHGARTPWNNHTCWKKWQNHWDCELKTLTAPPAQPEILQLEKNATEDMKLDGEGAFFLFEKNYDALMDPPQLMNLLNGTCQKGQLLLRGYVQELSNGQMLRSTYVKERGENKDNHDLVLIDLNEDYDVRPYEEPRLYYRADDDQRTIMSGQVLLRGLFGDLLLKHSQELGTQVDPTISVHTADRVQDILAANEDVCPRLNDLFEEAKKSPEYIKRFVKSKESKDLNKLMDTLGGDFRDQAEDCLMTTICNDRDLPDVLDDYGRDEENNYFDRLDQYSFRPWTYAMKYNDAAHSKLAFGPLWVEMLSNMLGFVPKSTWSSILPQMVSELRNPAPQLALFSGHDTTILPILATLGEKVWDGSQWAPYASLLSIEIHAVEASNQRLFRLIYNGKVLTDKMNGCDNELCDVIHLFNRVSDFAVKQRDCSSSMSFLAEIETWTVGDVLSSKKGLGLILIFTIFSGGLGAFLTYVSLTRRLPCSRSKGNFKKVGNEDNIEVISSYGAADTVMRNNDLKLEENTII